MQRPTSAPATYSRHLAEMSTHAAPSPGATVHLLHKSCQPNMDADNFVAIVVTLGPVPWLAH